MHDLLTAEDSVVRFDREANESDGRSIIVRLLSWGEVAVTPQGREAFDRGAFSDVDPTEVLIESQRHNGAIVGRGESLEEAEDGPYLRARISETSEGNDLLRLIQDGVLTRASISFIPEPGSTRVDGGILHRTKAAIRRLAILPRGAYPSAQVLAVREETHDMTDTAPVEAPEAVTAPVDLTPINDRLDAIDAAIASVSAASAVPPANPDTLDRYASFGDAWMAATEDPEVRNELHRALADITTGDIPGLVPPAWLTTIRGMVTNARRGINAFGGPQALPAEGMEFNWPKVDATTRALADSAIIAEQLTEKSELVSAVIGFDSAKTSIKTFGGAADISWQALRRSSPSYRDAYLRYVANRWGWVTNVAFWAGVVGAAGVDTDTLTLPATSAGADALLGLLFDKSTGIEGLTGQPADVVVAASDVFIRLGSMGTVLPPAAYGTFNVPGTAQASNLSVNVSGLRVIHEPAMTAGHLIVASSTAAKWHEEGSPYVAEETEVAKLGTNIAVWSMGACAVYEPEAISDITVTLA